MNVLLIIHNQHGTGPYPKVMELAQGLSALGAEVTVLCTSRRARWRLATGMENGVRVVQAPDLLWGRLRQGADPWNVLRRWAWARRQPFDVVHAIDSRPVVILPALGLRRRTATTLIMSWWDLFGSGGVARDRSGSLYAATGGRVEQLFEERFRLWADAATVISTTLERRLREAGFPGDRILLQRLGCDTRRFQPISKEAARAQLGVPAEGPVLCYVGALAALDLDLFLQGLERAQASQRGRLTTLLVGGPEVGAAAAARVALRSVPRQPLEVVHRYISASDLCLLPLRESPANRARWPSKCGDYLNAGRPVLTTPVGDDADLVRRHDLGFVAPAATPEGLAAAIDAAIESRPAWDAIGMAARRFAEQQLDVSVLAAQLLDFYRSSLPRAGEAKA